MPKFVPRERKHRRLARQREQANGSSNDANAETIVPSSKPEKEEKRRVLKEQLRAQQPNATINSKKRQRLDKYIDTKLKKEENLELLKKLAAQKVDTSLLQSAKKLGRVSETKKERFQRALQERESGIDVNGEQDTILFERRPQIYEDEYESSDDQSADSDAYHDHEADEASDRIPVTAFGSGLKRPLDLDDAGQPVITKRKRRKQAKLSRSTLDVNTTIATDRDEDELPFGQIAEEETFEEWNGFGADSNPSASAEELTDDSDDDEESLFSVTSESEADTQTDRTGRTTAFKAWADVQRNQALDFTPSVAPTTDSTALSSFKPREPSPDFQPSSTELFVSRQDISPESHPRTAIPVDRTEEVQSTRSQLPVVQDEQKIIEAVYHHPVIVVCGSTGSGKTTQVPQMLFENGYTSRGMIGVTQPRRVAAVSVASRVSFELGSQYGKLVAHQVRYDSNVGRDTIIKFMTDGILLREISNDFSLRKYSVIVIDEAHERGVNTDILIGMLSRIIPLRQELSQEEPDKYSPLKMIIMSATLRVADFAANDKLFRSIKPPIVEVEGQQYPVTVHFARKTQRDYVTEIVQKVSRGHKKLPPGGMLVFLTGQVEIETVAAQLKDQFSSKSLGFHAIRDQTRERELKQQNQYIEDELKDDSESDVEIKLVDDDASDDGDAEFMITEDDFTTKKSLNGLTAYILPLHASLPSQQQMRVFQQPPEGSRLIVLATNVAETSLTIPGIRYVFDCGRSKEKRYDESTGVQEYAIDWISKASASQRTGRAGRTGPGHCYRLYSSAVFEQYFEQHTKPEIQRTPIEGTVLQLKSMEVDNVVNFPFPTPPQLAQLTQAERLLRNLAAIDDHAGKITNTGKELIKYPVNPRFGKMLLLGLKNDVLAHTIALVAGLAVGDIFMPEPRLANGTKDGGASSSDEDSDYGKRQERRQAESVAHESTQKRHQAFSRAQAELSRRDDQSDAMKLLTAVAAHAQAAVDQEVSKFCSQYFVREKNMDEVQRLRLQLHNLIPGQAEHLFQTALRLTTDRESKTLKQIVAAGFIDQVAIRVDLLPASGHGQPGRKSNRAIDVPYRTLLSSNGGTEQSSDPNAQEQQKNVYLHPSSVLSKLSVKEMPSYIAYSHLTRGTANAVGSVQRKKARMHPLTTLGPKQLAALSEGTPLLEMGKPIGKIEELEPLKRQCWVGVSIKEPSASGTTAWPLGAWKVAQVKQGKNWIVEKVISK